MVGLVVVGSSVVRWLGLRIEKRDFSILRQIYRFRFCLGRHIKALCDFTGARACDRRLKLLIEAGYLERQKVLYGIPSLYYLTKQGKQLLGVSLYQDKNNISRIPHNIGVLDAVCYFKEKYGLALDDIKSEKELHSIDGFGVRKHKPDFVITYQNENIAVEIELTLKAKRRFEENVKSNFLNYDKQIWIVPRNETRITSLLTNWQASYDNIEILLCEEVINN